MNAPSGAKAPTRALTRALSLCAAVACAAAAAAPGPDNDRRVAALKDEALQLASALNQYEQALIHPDQTRVSIYIGVRVNAFLLESVELRLDDAEVVSYSYSDSEARALLQQGLHRALTLNVTPGPHRLRVDFSGRFADARPDDEPVRGSIQTIFDKGLEPLHLVLPVAREARGPRPALPEVARLEVRRSAPPWDPTPRLWRREAAEGSFEPGSEEDPRLGMARFLKNDGRYFSALVELLDIARSVGDPDRLAAEYHWLAAECYLGFGMRDRAAQVYRLLAVTATDHDTLNKARLRLAELDYQRGYAADTVRALLDMRERMPQTMLVDWQDLLSRALMAQGRYNEAVEVLTEPDNARSQTPFMRFNLGVALINDGRVAQGRGVLDSVGRMTVRDQDELALRDRANLVLGYHFLQHEQGATAKPVFARVRIEGPYSNRALLGMGWAELAPAGERQAKTEVGDEFGPDVPYRSLGTLGVLIRPGYFDPDVYKRMQLRPFKQGRTVKKEEEALLKALAIWVELAKRDPIDPAVQEAMLAIPYALDRLGAHEQALIYYLRAIDLLEASREQLDEGVRSLGSGLMVHTIVRRDLTAERGWTWRLRDLPDLPETYWLAHLIAEHRFQESLKNYRDVRLMAHVLEEWSRRTAAVTLMAGNTPTVPVQAQIRRVRRAWTPDYAPPLTLRADTHLGAALASAGDSGVASRPIRLRLAPPPARFDGPWQRLQTAQPRLDALSAEIRQAVNEQSRLLRDIGAGELESIRQQLDRYLVEARFAVARIYDQQRRQGSAQSDDGGQP